MNVATKTAIFRQQSRFSLLKTAFFHSTPVLERKSGSSPSSSVKSKAKKNKRSNKFLREHQEKKLNVKKFLWEHQEKVHRAVEELRRKREEAASKKAKEDKENLNNCTSESQFGYEDKDFDALFRSVFGEPRVGFDYSIYEECDRRWWYHPSWFSGFCMTSWISTRRYYNNEEMVLEEEEEFDPELYDDEQLYEDEEDPELDEDEEESYSSSNHRNSWRSEEEYGYGSVLSDPMEATHRETLGLSPWGPLKLEDVKHAYRTCALKWHPDRHDDSTKAEAEAKFKFCNVAYEYLIQKLQ